MINFSSERSKATDATEATMRTLRHATFFLPKEEDLDLWITEAENQGDEKTAEELKKIRDQQREAGRST